jgi:hypothetical protein
MYAAAGRFLRVLKVKVVIISGVLIKSLKHLDALGVYCFIEHICRVNFNNDSCL